MARLPALVAALARTDGRDAETLGWIARVAREQGLITTTKRGTGAAEMTPRDAANLLIAANVADAPREALPLVPMVRAFVPRLPSEEDRTAADVFGEITRAENFGDALEAAIDGALEIAVRLSRAHDARFSDEPLLQGPKSMFALGLAGFSVEFHRRAGPVRVRMALWERREGQVLTPWEWVFEGDLALIESGHYARQAEFDRNVRVTIGLKTLAHLSVALRLPDERTAETAAELGLLEGAAE
jgi:hypothetical protein